MHRLRQRVSSRLVAALCVAALLAIVCSDVSSAAGTSASNAKLGGTWAGSYSGSYTGTFTIRWRQKSSWCLSRARSRSRVRTGRTASREMFEAPPISFGAVGAGATYTGSVSGSSMSGHYPTGDGGRSRAPGARTETSWERLCPQARIPGLSARAGGSGGPRVWS